MKHLDSTYVTFDLLITLRNTRRIYTKIYTKAIRANLGNIQDAAEEGSKAVEHSERRMLIAEQVSTYFLTFHSMPDTG